MNKYRAIKTIIDGIKFDSKAESRRYIQLKALEQTGFIKNLRNQVKFELTPKLKRNDGSIERPSHYIADFVYVSGTTGLDVVEDVKGGKSTQLFIQKRKIMLNKYGITVIEVRNNA